MFVNDTTRLPDSGRVCVKAFRDTGEAGRPYYSLLITAARAEVEPMAEPRNPAHVLGVGAEIESVNGPVFAAYFAANCERFDAHPNYRQALFVLVDGAVYAVQAERVDVELRRGFSTRRFTLSRAGRPQRSVEYPWPWYREPFGLNAAAGGQSADFMREIMAVVREYGAKQA